MIDKSSNFVVAIIPARGGSKGLYKKNIQTLNGKPLIAYTIEAAKKSQLVDKVVVTTDDQDIRNISIEHGADAPFLRDPNLSGDDVPCNPVIKDCHGKMENYYRKKIDIILYMQPTEVFRKIWMIDQSITELINNEELDTAFVAYASHKNFWQIKNNSPSRLISFNEHLRQDKIPVYREDTGLACASRRRVILQGLRIGKNVKIIPHMSELGSIDIHTKQDLLCAEAILSLKDITIND